MVHIDPSQSRKVNSSYKKDIKKTSEEVKGNKQEPVNPEKAAELFDFLTTQATYQAQVIKNELGGNKFDPEVQKVIDEAKDIYAAEQPLLEAGIDPTAYKNVENMVLENLDLV